MRGHLRAIDPMTGKSKWAISFKSPNWAGTLVTDGGLVFTGQLTGTQDMLRELHREQRRR